MGKTTGHGNYVPVPAPEEALAVGNGETLNRVFVLGRDAVPGAVTVGEDASLAFTFIALPGVSADIDLSVFLEGRRSEATLSGVFVESGGDRVCLKVDLRHLVPDCKSEQTFNTIASGDSRFSFDGKITVAPDAQNTEAYQTNRNILLSDGALVQTKPQLEIYADDVKCSHGATTGRLNEEEQFYMRSRGIPENEARVLQMLSFISPVLSRLPSGSDIPGRLEQAIRSL